MDILLIASDTIFNSIIREKTNSPWGHSSVVINDIVYDFDYGEKNKYSLSTILKDKSISRASLFYLDMGSKESDAVNLYKKLFNEGGYDTCGLLKLKQLLTKVRSLEDIQSSEDLYTCSNLIAKVNYEQHKKREETPHILDNIHWSQAIPHDYSTLKIKEEYNFPK